MIVGSLSAFGRLGRVRGWRLAPVGSIVSASDRAAPSLPPRRGTIGRTPGRRTPKLLLSRARFASNRPFSPKFVPPRPMA